MARPSGRPMRDEVLEAARPLIQQVGVDGFSYADIAKQLNISSPSIHHHFPKKTDLVAEVALLYRNEFADRVKGISDGPASSRLLRYANLFDQPASAGLLCLCGAIAADWPNLTEGPRQQVELFFADQHAWLVEQLVLGSETNELRQDIDQHEVATALLAALEGSMLVARASSTPDLASAVMGALLQSLTLLET